MAPVSIRIKAGEGAVVEFSMALAKTHGRAHLALLV